MTVPKPLRLIHRPWFWRTILYPLMAFILFLATSNDPYPVPSSSSDKINHVLAFAALGLLASWSYPKQDWHRLLPLLMGYGLAVEAIQAFLPHRQFSLLDLAADAFGAILGLTIGLLLLHYVSAPSRR